MTADKRAECGCHIGCIGTEHGCGCDNPCRWPSCLTDAEHSDLIAEIVRDELLGGPEARPTVKDGGR
jgi:hypothetical protein